MKGWTQADIDRLQNQKPKTLSPEKRYQALGRLKSGTMNKTEASYAKLLETLKSTGSVLWYAFEPVNLRIAPKCFYAVDFMVMMADGQLECREVKGGFIADDSLVKIKAASVLFPFKFKIVQLKQGNWEEREF